MRLLEEHRGDLAVLAALVGYVALVVIAGVW